MSSSDVLLVSKVVISEDSYVV